MIKMRNTLAALVLAAASLMPALSQAQAPVWVDRDPPPPRVEQRFARSGHAWAPGYWRWDGHRYIWARGHWVRERYGYHWLPAHWVQYGRHWEFIPGHWAR